MFTWYHTILQIFFAGDNIDNKEHVSVGVGGYSMKLRDFMHQKYYYVHVSVGVGGYSMKLRGRNTTTYMYIYSVR